MNLTLFNTTLKSNWLILGIIFTVMFMYLTMIIPMYDPDSMDSLNAMLDMIPKEMASAMGYDNLFTDLTSFIASFYYGFLIIMFPMIYTIIVANRLIAKHVDRGSMTYLLSTPNSRLKIVITQAMYLIISIIVLFGSITIFGIAVSEAMFSGQLDRDGFILLNLCALLTFFAISGICFFFSCIFNDTKQSLAFGAGIPIAFFVINMLSNVSEEYAWLGNLSLFSLFNPTEILAGNPNTAISCVILAVTGIILYISGIIIFDRRNLPL